MELQDLENAIAQHEQRLIQFGAGTDRHCFLYKNKWYPVRFFVNAALEIAGEQADQNLRNCLDKLQDILPYVRQQSMQINPNTPISLTDRERLDEVAILNQLIKQLTDI